MEILIPVVTLIIGWFLSQASISLQSRRISKEALSSAISDLLEIRHQFKSTAFVFKEWESRYSPTEEYSAQLKILTGRIIPKQENLHKRYDESVSQLAKNNPLLAYEIRSKDLILLYFKNFEALCSGDAKALILFKNIESRLHEIIIPELERVIKYLSFKFSLITYCKILILFSRQPVLPEEYFKILDEYETNTENEEFDKKAQ